MLHKGTRTTGTSLSPSENQLVGDVLDCFIEEVERLAVEQKIRRAVIRSRLSCNIVVLLDDKNLILIAEPANGMPNSAYSSEAGKVFSSSDLDAVARYDLGFSNYFYVIFPKDIFQKTSEQKQGIIRAIAMVHVDNEVRRVIAMNNLIQINPIFGPASYTLCENLVFVLMPFTDNLTKIYTDIIKPTAEEPKFNLICKRADDLKSAKPIIQDIWKSICEANLL